MSHLAAIFSRRDTSKLTWTLHSAIAGSTAGNNVYHDGTYWRLDGSSTSQFYATDPTAGWTSKLVAAINPITSAYGDGNWVIGGGNLSTFKFIWWVADPTASWNTTLVTGGFPLAYDILDLHNDGTYWITAGAGGVMRRAADPTGAWSAITSSFGSTQINYVQFADGIWAAVGDNNTIATSPDASTWTQVSSPPFGATDDIDGVWYGNGVWVAVGECGQIATTTNPGSGWTLNTSPFGAINLKSVHYGSDGYWVICDTSGRIATAV